MSEMDEVLRAVAFADPSRSILAEIVPALRSLLGADQALAYRLGAGEEGYALDFAHGLGIGSEKRFSRILSEYVSKATQRVTTYEFPFPAPKERNTVHLLRDEEARRKQDEAPLVRDLFPTLGLAGQDQIRTLVCDGSRLLSWVGAFRQEPFGPEEEKKLEQIIPLLEHRLKVEETIGRLTARAAALDVSIEAHRRPTFFLGRSGEVLHANGAGRAMSRDDREALLDAGKRLLRSGSKSNEVTLHRIDCSGIPPHYLLMQHRVETPQEERLRIAAHTWCLSRRQAEVLSLVLEGRSNREIAEALRVVEGTVELHVSALFRKVSVHSRGELVAAFWSSAKVQ